MKLPQRFSTFFFALCLLAVAGCASGPQKEGTGEYVDDAVITTKVKAALVQDSTVKATEVKVDTFKGVVQLSGFVSTREEMSKAAEIARGVSGVKSVKNNISLKP